MDLYIGGVVIDSLDHLDRLLLHLGFDIKPQDIKPQLERSIFGFDDLMVCLCT